MTFIATKLFHKAGEGSGGGGGDQHNLGWYATESALTTAHPTATAGDWAIVGSTDTVWLWDTDNEEWVDSDQKGQVTSVNGQTGDVVLDLLPDQTGQSGKFLTTDGTDASWGNEIINNAVILTSNSTSMSPALILRTSDVNNGAQFYYNKSTNNVQLLSGTTNPGTGAGRTLSVGKLSPIGNQQTLGDAGQWNRWLKTYTQNLNSGNTNAGDIIVPDVGGTMAVIQVNTTITLAAADWSSNTQTVSVTGVTSTSVVFVAPDPADTTDYVSAGILCTSQTTNSLTFTATTTPTSDIAVNVVCL